MAGDRPDITKRRPGKTDQARSLRQNETEAEFRLWSDLRNRQLNGHKFSRQVPLGAYVADFVCREQHLIVELDGSQHAENATDERRTFWLNEHGYSVLRFWNDEVRKERRAVLETILAALEGQIADECRTLRFSPAKPESRGPPCRNSARFAPPHPALRATFAPLGRRGSAPRPRSQLPATKQGRPLT